MFRDRSGNSLILFSLLVDYGNLLALDLRGHGPLAAHRGDIDCIGQFEDDVAHLIDLYARPGQKLCWPVTVLGVAWRCGFWRKNYHHKVHSAILLAPFIYHNAPAMRPNAEGWSYPLVCRVFGLSF